VSIIRKIIRRAGMIASMAFVPTGRRHIRQVSGPGFELLAFLNEDVGRVLWLTGAFEREESHYLQSVIRSDDVCFDIGGNVGYMAMLFAAKATQGQVHVFEPIDLNAALITANAVLNGLSNVIVNNVAVGASNGTVQFSVSSDTAYSSMHPTGRRKEARSIEVPVISLDEYLADRGIDRVDVMKVDVEGAENLVLDGARKLLGNPRTRPRVILVELFDNNLKQFGSSVEACIQIMQKYGYEPWIADSGSERLLPFDRRMANKNYNVLFLSK
jgi:FkbM family methyltransferase